MAKTRCPKTGRFNTFQLGDDGTLDTVVMCSECGAETRYNYDRGMEDGTDEDQPQREQDALDRYDEWVDEICIDAAEAHEMGDKETL